MDKDFGIDICGGFGIGYDDGNIRIWIKDFGFG